MTTRRLLALVLTALLAAGACAAERPATETVRVLASADLADLAPLLTDLRRDTGIDLQLDLVGPTDAAFGPLGAGTDHPLAWLSTDRVVAPRSAAMPVDGVRTMTTPVAVGLTPAAAARLRPDRPPSWSDLAGPEAQGRLRLAAGDPRHSPAALAALVGIATAAAGTGRALRLEDVRCEASAGLAAAVRNPVDPPGALVEDFVRHQDDLDGLVATEAALVTLNASGRLRTHLQIVYPDDGIVMFDHPLLLLDPARREVYDRIAAWLRDPRTQRRISEVTARRPVDPSVSLRPDLPPSVGNALYFPGDPTVLDRLLAIDGAARRPVRVILLLDGSGSIRGAGLDALRSAVAALARPDPGAGPLRPGDRVSVLWFGSRVLSEQEFAVEAPGGPAALRDVVPDGPDGSTAVWSALEDADRRAAALRTDDPERTVSIVLVTDGRNTVGPGAADYLARLRPPGTPVLAIGVGDADMNTLARVADATGGRALRAGDGDPGRALEVLRGCS